MLTQKLLSVALVGTEWVIWLLLLLSIFSLAVIVDRFLVLNRKRGDIDELRNRVDAVAFKGSDAEFENILLNDPSAAASVASDVIRNMKDMRLDFEDCLAMALSEEKLRLDRRIVVLGTLGNNAPFVGLLGTVLGVIHAFHNLSTNVKGGPGVVMAGISEALVATALGLFVAIPAVAAYNYFVREIKKIMIASENFTRLVVFPYVNRAGKKG